MKPNIKKLNQQVEKFNKMYPIGTPVKIKKDGGDIYESKVRTEAIVLGGHSAVAHFDGISGCYDIQRVV